MKTCILILLFAGSPLTIFGQVVQGRILDAYSLEPIAYAAVYFNGTFMGTATDKHGKFEIDVSRYSSIPLTISAVGYYSHKLTDYTAENIYVLHLFPKIYELDEVEISRRMNKKERKSRFKHFRNEFLGSTANSRSCVILNEETIIFLYNSGKDTLRAFTLEPIQIHNRALGYNITFYLDDFVCCRKEKTLYFTGNIMYTEDLTTLRRFSERKRRLAYKGSRMHFFRALWADDLRSNRFSVNNDSGEELVYEDIVYSDNSNTKFLHYPEGLIILYSNTWSRINFHNEYAFFDSDGYFDATSMGWVGHMSRKRIGDQLPYEYDPED